MREDLFWRETWHDMDGNESIIINLELSFGSKICRACYTNIKPVLTCRKCKNNACDACALWSNAKNKSIIVYCPACKNRLGVLI